MNLKLAMPEIDGMLEVVMRDWLRHSVEHAMPGHLLMDSYCMLCWTEGDL